MTFDFCVLAAKNSGFSGRSLGDFVRDPWFGAIGLFDWAYQEGQACTGPAPVYVCPGSNRTREQITRCGDAGSFYCATWGCETTGTAHWLTNSNKGLIQVKLPQNSPSCTTLSSIPGQCFPLQIKFTSAGQGHPKWYLAETWGLHLYQAGYDNGFQFELRL